MDDYKTPGKKIALSRSQLQTIYTLIQRPDVHQLPAESIQRPIIEWHGNRDLDIIELVTKFKRGHDTLTTQIRDSLQNDATAKAQAVNSAQSLWNTTAPSVPGRYPFVPITYRQDPYEHGHPRKLDSPPATP